MSAAAGGGVLPTLPKPDFRLLWNGITYSVSKHGVGATDVYTAAQMRAFGRECLRSHGPAVAELIAAAKDYEAHPYDAEGVNIAARSRLRAALSNIEGGRS